MNILKLDLLVLNNLLIFIIFTAQIIYFLYYQYIFFTLNQIISNTFNNILFILPFIDLINISFLIFIKIVNFIVNFLSMESN